MSIPFVYILHFNEPLAHACHYIGCTTDLKGRLERHAIGRGARIIRELSNRGISWKVGGLYRTTKTMLRRLERDTKNQHNSKRYCEHCNHGLANRMSGAVPYPLNLVPFSTSSRDLAGRNNLLEIVFGTSTEECNGFILSGVKKLSDQHKNELGFIPMGDSSGIIGCCNRGQIYYAKRGGELIGYCLFTRNQYELVIHQICVNDADKGCGIGRYLIENVEADNSHLIMRCSVREDLAANGFWLAMGFKETERIKHLTSGSTLVRYQGIDRLNLLIENAK